MKASLWSNMFFDCPPEEVAERLVRAGFGYAEFDYVHIAGLFADGGGRVDAFVDLCGRLGLRIGQLHAPLSSIFVPKTAPVEDRLIDLADFRDEVRDREVGAVETAMAYCAAVGIDVIVTHPGGIGDGHSPERIEKVRSLNIETYTRLAEKASSTGVKVAVENMMTGEGRRDCWGSYVEELLSLLDAVRSDDLGICLDTSHANVTGVDVPAFIDAAGDRLIATHISDNLGENDDHLMPYSGVIDWSTAAEAFGRIGYSGLINLEIPGENGHRCQAGCPIDVRQLKAGHARQMLDAIFG